MQRPHAGCRSSLAQQQIGRVTGSWPTLQAENQQVGVPQTGRSGSDKPSCYLLR
jgi:hypothetical protein